MAISINDKTLEKIDKIRGNKTREEFLEELLAAKLDEEEESESEAKGERGLEEVLEKLGRIDELTDKILKLEKRQADLEDGLNNADGQNDTPETVETEDGELVETFRFSEEDIIDDDDLEDDDDDDGSSNYEFVFGCTHCSETVEEQDIVCPACGSDLGDVHSTLNWLERMGRRHEDEFVDDDVYYYDENDDYIDEEYDPAPRRPQEDFAVIGVSSPAENGRPYCNSCGGVTEYIDRYDSWYCYRCSAYADERPVGGAEADGQDRTQVLDRILSRRHETKEKKAATGDKPLKYYAPYASTEAVTKISLMDDDDKPSKRKKR